MYQWNMRRGLLLLLLDVVVVVIIGCCCCYSEVNSGIYYKSAAEREKLVDAERHFTNDKVTKVIELKNKVIN